MPSGGVLIPPFERQRQREGGDVPRVPCGLCSPDLMRRGSGEVCNPGNADRAVKLSDWLPPIPCPRCECTGWDPNP